MAVKKLLVVTDEMEVGGSQRQISYLLDGLDRNQWQPELLFFRHESFLVKDLRAKGIKVHHLPKRGRLDIAFLLQYAALLKKQRYDVIHAFSLTAELWTLFANRLAGTHARMVASVRGLYLSEPDWFWRIKRFIIGRSAAVIANAKAGAAAAALRAGLPLSRFDVIPNGIVPSTALMPGEAGILRRSIGVPGQRCFGLFVGRLVKEKNVACLLHALAALPPQQRPWIALAGNGPLRESIEALREQLGLNDDVRFLGERSDAGKLMKCADFLVLPSSHEGMSNVLMEAMEAGCPVIASNVGGNPELVQDQVTGLLFPSNLSPALAAQLQKMASHPELRQQLAQAARQYIHTRYSIQNLAAQTSAVYVRCLVSQISSETMQHGRLSNSSPDEKA